MPVEQKLVARHLFEDLLGGVRKPTSFVDRDNYQFPNGSRLGVFYVPADHPTAPADGQWVAFGTRDVTQSSIGLTQLGGTESSPTSDATVHEFRLPGVPVLRLYTSKTDLGFGPMRGIATSPRLRDAQRTVYVRAFGARLEPASDPNRDVFTFPNGTRFEVAYRDGVGEATEPTAIGGAWLEIRVASVPSTLAVLDGLGIRPFPYDVDPGHAYVQAPGGQVIRIAPIVE